MFKQLSRANHAFRLARGATKVNARWRRDKDQRKGKDRRKSFAEKLASIARRTGMDMDEKIKELSEMFSKTGREFGELVKRNEQFITDEIRRVEDAVRKTTEACAKGKMDRLRDVKGKYEERIKICNEKAAAGLRAAKEICEQRVEEVDDLRSSMKQILKECLETNEFVKCMASETKEAVKRRAQTTKELNESVQNAEQLFGKLKEAAKCHADAKTEALETLREILKDTKDCVK